MAWALHPRWDYDHGQHLCHQSRYLSFNSVMIIYSWPLSDPTRFVDPHIFNPERYLRGPESTRALPSYIFGLGRRGCPAAVLAHREVAAVASAFVQWFELSVHDGEREFDPVGANDSHHGFNRGPKRFRLQCRVRDRMSLEKYLAEDSVERM
jgi:cytochrome P450